MAVHRNHVRERLARAEAEIASLREWRARVTENVRWTARTVAFIALTVGANSASGTLGRLLGELAKLFGRGIA